MQPRTSLLAAPPPGFERVELRTEDGTDLRAWYAPSSNGAVVVVLPGSGGTKGDVREHAAALQRHGYGVLALDARGHGESGGVGNAWGWRGDLDVRAAVDYALSRPDVDPARVGVLGLSMGAEQAITAAASDRRIGAVIAEGASARTAGDVTWLGDAPTDLVDRVMYPILWGLVDVLTEAREPVLLREAVAAAQAPILLIVGNDAAEVGAAPLLIGAAPDRVEPWILPDTPHIAALVVHPQEWETRVIGFLDRHLR